MSIDLSRLSSGGTYPTPLNSVILNSTYTNSTVSGSNVFELFRATAASTFFGSAYLWVSSAATTTGIQLGAFYAQSGLIISSAVRVCTASAVGTELITHQAFNAYQSAVAGLTTPTLARIDFWIRLSGSSSSAATIGAKSEVSGSAVTIHPGSYAEWRQVA